MGFFKKKTGKEIKKAIERSEKLEKLEKSRAKRRKYQKQHTKKKKIGIKEFAGGYSSARAYDKGGLYGGGSGLGIYSPYNYAREKKKKKIRRTY